MVNNNKVEVIWYIIGLMFLLFVYTNANQQLANAYLWFYVIGLSLVFYNTYSDRSIRVTFQKSSGGHLKAIFSGLQGFIVLILSAFLVLRIVDPIHSSFGSIVTSLGAANPVFSASVIINFIVVGFVVAYGETALVARILEFIADFRKIPISNNTKFLARFVLLALLLSVAFSVFHLTSKGVDAISGLVIVGLMMFISIIMIAIFGGEYRQAFWLHAIANSTALILARGGGII